MLIHHNWLFPQSGGRPWLERPPVTHWILIATSVVLGQHCDAVWVVRLPSVLMATSIVLMTAWMASLWFGRSIGLLSGFVLATTYEFYAYAVLAEDDIFLAAAVVLAIALFVKIEFGDSRGAGARPMSLPSALVQNRGWPYWLLFLDLGLMNMVKSPLVGPVVVIAPVGAYLLLTKDARRLVPYVWLWGAIIFAILFFSWTRAAVHYYPDVRDNWKFDYQDTTEYDGPFWYYPVNALGGLCMPWIWASIIGFLATRKSAIAEKSSGARFVWSWAILPVIVLSIPHRKHHHYLVPSLAPWAILSAIGINAIGQAMLSSRRKPANPRVVLMIATMIAMVVLISVAAISDRRKIPMPLTAIAGLVLAIVGCVGLFSWGMWRKSGAMAAGAVFVGIAVTYCWGQSFSPDMVAQDTAFLRRVNIEVPANQPLYVNSDLGGEMDFFRNQFYLPPSAGLLHNLTYLLDDKITAADVWVITPHRDLAKLQKLGEVSVADESIKTRREKSPEDRFTLFHVYFSPGLARYPLPPYVTTMQAMDRAKGPYCGGKPL